MTAYVIAKIEVTDPAAYESYKVLSTRAVLESGGRFLVRGGNAQVLEGDWEAPRLVVIEFASVELAKSFYDGEAYRAARLARAKAAKMQLAVVEGAAP